MALCSHGIEMIPSQELFKLKNKRVLDISAGTGTSSKFLKKYCGDISATEARPDSFCQKDIPVSFLNVEDVASLEEKIKMIQFVGYILQNTNIPLLNTGDSCSNQTCETNHRKTPRIN